MSNEEKSKNWKDKFPHAPEDVKVLCHYCRLPIHIDEWGGVLPNGDFFHKQCYIDTQIDLIDKSNS